MFTHYRTQGFIVKKTDRGEADRLFTVYTKDFGKLEVLAKAVRKIKSKLRPGLEIFYLSEIEFIQGKAYKTLTDALGLEKFENLRKDLKKMNIAYRVSGILEGSIRGQEPDKKIWQLLKETFERLSGAKNDSGCKMEIVYHYFLWNFLSLLGYRPEFYHCVLCQKNLSAYHKNIPSETQNNLRLGPIPEKIYFNRKEGGLICNNCFKKVKLGKEASIETIKILRIILEKNWAILSRLRIKEPHLDFLSAISDYYFSGILKQNE